MLTSYLVKVKCRSATIAPYLNTFTFYFILLLVYNRFLYRF